MLCECELHSIYCRNIYMTAEIQKADNLSALISSFGPNSKVKSCLRCITGTSSTVHITNPVSWTRMCLEYSISIEITR